MDQQLSLLFSCRHGWKLFEVSYRADVVTATCVRAGDMILDGQCLHLCVIDEATHVSCNSITPLKAPPSNSHFPMSYRGVFPTALKHPRLNPSHSWNGWRKKPQLQCQGLGMLV
jgi:hypothetical protein